MNANTQSASSVLSDAIVVACLIDVWSGKITVIRDQDLDDTARTNLPPHAIYSDGQKQIINPKVLAKLETPRRMAQRDLVSLGFRSPLGYIIAPQREQELYDRLEVRRQEFEAGKQDIIQNLAQYYDEWERENPGHEAFLRRKRPNASEVDLRCRFDFAVYRVMPVESEHGQQRFEAVAQATVPSLVRDIASNAGSILKSSFAGKARVTQRQLGAVRDLVAKLKGFSMFDPRVLPSAQALEAVLSKLPHTGPLDPMETTIVGSMLRSLSDPDEVLAISARQFLAGVDTDTDEDDTSSASQADQSEQDEAPDAPQLPPKPPVQPSAAPVIF